MKTKKCLFLSVMIIVISIGFSTDLIKEQQTLPISLWEEKQIKEKESEQIVKNFSLINDLDLKDFIIQEETYVNEKTEFYIEEVLDKEKSFPILNLTKEWSSERNYLTLKDGKGKINISLFLDKSSDFNFGKGQAPDGRSVLIWNATEAVTRFGTVVLKPGDEFSFTEEIEFGDIITQTKILQNKQYREDLLGNSEKSDIPFSDPYDLIPGEKWFDPELVFHFSQIHHGAGYIRNGEGACYTATVFGEGLGLFIRDNQEKIVPLFKTEIGAIQPHALNDPEYYAYMYHGPGVAINSGLAGQLKISLNSELPKTVVVTITMEIQDTNPTQTNFGTFSPIVRISIEGFPEGWEIIEYLRLTGNRAEVLKAISGRDW